MNIPKKLVEAREHLATLYAQRNGPACTNASRAEAREAIAAQIEEWHSRAVDRIETDLQQIAAGEPVNLLASADSYGYQVPVEVRLNEQEADVRAWITFALGKSEMLNRFKPLLDRLPEGLDSKARAEHMRSIESQIVQAEVIEESLIRDAEAQGVSVDPRPGQRAEAAILVGFGGT